jgi:hypothetical protein
MPWDRSRASRLVAMARGNRAFESYSTGSLRMMKRAAAAVLAMAFACSVHASDDEHHSHPAPEQLGRVTFATSCTSAVKPAFEQALALLHSFAYTASEHAFRDVAGRDSGCAIAHWGIAMSLFHQLWEPPSGDELREGAEQIRTAVEIRAGSLRERQFIEALDTYYRDPDQEAPAARAERYARAMADVARNTECERDLHRNAHTSP